MLEKEWGDMSGSNIFRWNIFVLFNLELISNSNYQTGVDWDDEQSNSNQIQYITLLTVLTQLPTISD